MDNDNILALINKTPDTLMQSIAKRVKQRRLELNSNICQKNKMAKFNLK